MNQKKLTRFVLPAFLIVVIAWAGYFLLGNLQNLSRFGLANTLAPGFVYYVDADLGSDANLGTSPDVAWQSLAKVNAQTFQGGDSILFKKGNQWRGGITIKILGNETIPVTVGAYGDITASSPIINGAVPAPIGWNQVGPSIYSLSLASSSAASFFKQVIVDGNRLDPARTPNTGYFTIDQVISPTSFISSSATSIFTANDVGSTTVYFRTINWRVDKRTVTGFDSSTNVVTFDSPLPTGYTLVAGQGFYLANNRSFVDQAGEWFYDETTKQLFVWLRSGDSPASHVVELSVTWHGLYSTADPGAVTVENLEFKNFRDNAIQLKNTTSTIRGNTISSSLERGMSLTSKNITVENNFIKDSYQGGISIYRSDLVDNVTIQSNTLENNGSLGNQANPGQALNGITLSNSVMATIANNVIKNSGYAGIVAWGIVNNSLVISSNTIENYCLYLNDCGGIYISGSSLSPSLHPDIGQNIVKNGVGNNEGTVTTYGTVISGIYLDLYASNATVHNNTVDRSTGHGAIYLHGGNNNTIDSNTIYQYSTWPTIAFLKDPDTSVSPPGIYQMSGNAISNNRFFVENIFNTVQDMQFYNTADSDNNYGTFINNTINSDLTTAITAPQTSASVSGIVSVNANATNSYGPVSKVEFYVDGTKISTDTTSPYSISWDTTSYIHNSTHTLFAKAYDTIGNIVTSNSISVTVSDVTAPTSVITFPVNNANVSGTVSITATSSDASGISKVEFYVDGALLSTGTTTPYSVSWNTSALAINSTHVLFAKSYDVVNNIGTSTSISVKIADAVVPTVSITAPANNSTVSRNSTVTISANASDNVGVSKVEFRVNNTLKCTDTTTPYSCAWTVPAQKNATYTLQSKAYDAANNSAISANVTVTAK